MTWRRRAALALGLLVLAAAVAFWLGVDHLTTQELTRSIRQAGQVRCEVRRVHLSVIDGTVSIRELVIGNPDGFPDADMFRFEKAAMDARVRTLTDQPIRVTYVEVIAPRIRLESKFGKTNVKVFLRNVKEYSKAKKKRRKAAGEGASAGKGPKRMIIDELRIVEGTVEIGSGFTKAGVPVRLDPITVLDVRGKDGRGVTIGQLSGYVVQLMVARAALQAGLDASTLIPRGLGSGLKKAVEWGGGVEKKAR